MENLNLDFDDLTIAEIEMIEEHTGLSVQQLGDESKPQGSTLRVLAWIIKRRTDPDFTLEDAGELSVSSLGFGGAGSGKAEASTDS